MGYALNTELVDFEALGKTSEREKANQLVPEIGRLLVLTGKSCSEEQLEVYDDVLMRLADIVELTARICLAEMMAPLERAPRALIRRLAQDDIAVAAPILLESKILDDIDLSYIAHTQSDEHLHAIARRETVSEPVSDILIEKGSDGVVTTLAGNSGAAISETGFDALVDRAGKVEELQARLAERSDLPDAAIKRLIEVASEKVRVALVANGKADEVDRVESAASIAKARIQGDVKNARSELSKAVAAVRKLHETGQLTPFVVMEFAERDQFAELVCGISVLAKARLDLTYQVMTQPNPGAFLVVAKAGCLGEDVVARVLESGGWRTALSREMRGKALVSYRRLNVDEAKTLRDRMSVLRPKK